MKITAIALTAALAFCLSPGAIAENAPDKPASSTVQRLIFDDPHFRSLKAPGDIYYSYLVAITNKKLFGTGFQDSVRLHLEEGKPDTPEKDATLYIYTGERERDPVSFKERTTNPVILMFLEQDLWRMRQRVGGRADYFKARVAAAMRDGVEVTQTTVKVDGRDVPATRVTFKPFENDPNAARLSHFTTKTYEFTLSEEVPGKVVELRTTVYDPGVNDGKPILEEKLSYDRAALGS